MTLWLVSSITTLTWCEGLSIFNMWHHFLANVLNGQVVVNYERNHGSEDMLRADAGILWFIPAKYCFSECIRKCKIWR